MISDVDETIAAVYEPASAAMVDELSSVLEENKRLLLVSGGGLEQVKNRVIDQLDPKLRRSVIVGHCNGAETWGFTQDGALQPEPYYSAYEDRFTPNQMQRWRTVTAQLLGEFGLRSHNVRPPLQFLGEVGDDPRDIMYHDRGAQITLEMVNAYELDTEQIAGLRDRDLEPANGTFDLRYAVVVRANELYELHGIPVTARLGGVFAVDLAVRDVNKATAIRHTLESPHVLESIGLTASMLQSPTSMEIWGDKFSKRNGGTDSHMSEAVDPSVRSIDFRGEDPGEFIEGYNIVVWGGSQHLQDGLLEYLQARH